MVMVGFGFGFVFFSPPLPPTFFFFFFFLNKIHTRNKNNPDKFNCGEGGRM